MSYKSIYRDVMRTYEASRVQAEALKAERRTSLYSRLPRLEEIDNALLSIGVNLTKLALSNDNTAIQQVRTSANTLQQEKAAILTANGIPQDYLTNVYNCKSCEDTGYLPAQPGQLPQRCACLKQKLVEAYYSLSNIKGVLEEENFDTYDYRCFSPNIIESEGLSPLINMQAVYRVATEFVQDFDTKFANLLLYGRTGLGKTFVCHCIAKDLLDAGYTVLYLTAPRLFKIIEDFRFSRDSHNEPSEMMEAVTDVDLLIMDDLGTEFVTVVTTSALFDIVNQRILTKKPTIISTNLSPTELEQHYSARITSRLTGCYQMIKFFGDDIRRRKKYGGHYEIPPD